MRYTEIDTTKSNSYRLKSGAVSESLEIMNGAYNKLGQLEDIEQELGIDLVTLIKALKNGFYYKDYEEKGYYDKPDILFVEPRSIELKGNFGFKKIMFDYCGVCIKDYGKTWALTKEELEK